MDILEGLIGACNKLRARATAEKAANAPSNAASSALIGGQTEVARKLLGIPASTKAEDIEELATLKDAELERLALLDKTLAETDPRQRALAFRQKASRFTSLKERIATAIGVVNQTEVDSLQTLIAKSNAAKVTAELAGAEFKAMPGQLPGTGGEEWKALFDAARAFAMLTLASASRDDEKVILINSVRMVLIVGDAEHALIPFASMRMSLVTESTWMPTLRSH